MTIYRLSVDRALGAIGLGLAAVSTTFGIYMNIHGQADGLGKSGEFSVFAQLAPRRLETPSRRRVPRSTDDLDMMETASIPQARGQKQFDAQTGPEPDPDHVSSFIPNVILRSVTLDHAEVQVDGRIRIVRVGDTIAGAGEVVAIRPGEHPSLRTSLGLVIVIR